MVAKIKRRELIAMAERLLDDSGYGRDDLRSDEVDPNLWSFLARLDELQARLAAAAFWRNRRGMLDVVSSISPLRSDASTLGLEIVADRLSQLQVALREAAESSRWREG